MLVRYGDLVGEYITGKVANTKLILWAKGAPGLPRPFLGKEKFLEAGYDIIIPDYYGFCRSGGLFTPQGCIDTLLDTRKTFSQGEVYDVLGQTTLPVAYQEILAVGGSFGGRVVGMLPKFAADITTIGLFYPELSCADLEKRGYPEEGNEEFIRQIKEGYAPLYRGIDAPERRLQEQDALGLTPRNNYEHLKNCKVFLAHGTADTCLHYTRTKEFYDKLLELNPQGIFKYAEYYGLEHGDITGTVASQGFLYRLSTQNLGVGS